MTFSHFRHGFIFDKNVLGSELMKDSSTWVVDSKTYNNSLEITSGLEFFIYKNFSFSLLLSYQNIIKGITKNDITTNIGVFRKELHETKISQLEHGFKISIEASISLNRYIKITVGTGYSFLEKDYFPTKKYSKDFNFIGNNNKSIFLVTYKI